MVAAALVFLLAVRAAAGDFPLKFNSPSQCTTEGGSEVELPVGRFLPEQDWLDHEQEWMRIEDDNTRLEAENESLLADDPPPWKAVALSLFVGIAIGRYALDR